MRVPTPTQLKNSTCDSILYEAVFKKNVEILKCLLEAKDDIESVINFNGYTPLHYAIKSCYFDIAELLLNSVVKTSNQLKGTKNSMVHTVALFDQRIELINLLHNFEANFNFKNSKGLTPIMVALQSCNSIYTDNSDFIKSMICCGADIHTMSFDIYSVYPIHLAALYGDSKNFKVLIEFGANIFITETRLTNVLFFAAENYTSSETLKMILDNLGFVHLNIKDTYNETPLHVVSKRSCENFYILLEHGGDVNLKDNDNKSPFLSDHLCYFEHNYERCPILEFFIKSSFLGYKVNNETLSEFEKMYDLEKAFAKNNQSNLFYHSELYDIRNFKLSTFPNFNLLDLILCKRKKLLKYIKNDHLLKLYKHCGGDFRTCFPEYGGLTNYVFRRCSVYNDLVEKVTDSLRILFETRLSESYCHDILSCFKEVELVLFSNELEAAIKENVNCNQV